MDRSVLRLHTLHGDAYLFVVADIAAQPQRFAAGVFYFQLGEIELRFAAAQ